MDSSSSATAAAAEGVEKADPFCDLESVDRLPLPLRLRDAMYCAIASASRSRIRVAIAAAGFGSVAECDGGERWWLLYDVPAEKDAGEESLSEVVVVRLPPEPLRMRSPLPFRGFVNAGDGMLTGEDPPHSFPRAAACANTFLRDFLLFSNCIRAVSCNVSLVLNLYRRD